jgi:DeoR/GlpR family transcriptional regulator of sugar metabolism
LIVFDCFGGKLAVSSDLSNIERQQQIHRLLIQQGRLTVSQICASFEISEATARRDLETLAGHGLIQRVHGGAIPAHQAAPESPLLERSREQSEEKARIGRLTAGLIQDGETIFLGSGTTVLEVARSLTARNITVITNSLPVINCLAERPDLTLVSIGGMLRLSEHSFIGHITEEALAQLRVGKVIMGIRALSLEHGLTNDYLPETQTDRAILKISPQIIILADHTKCGSVSTAYLAPISAIQTLVTDRATNPEFIQSIRESGITVLIA